MSMKKHVQQVQERQGQAEKSVSGNGSDVAIRESKLLPVKVERGITMIDIAALDQRTRERVEKLEAELQAGAESVGTGVLAMGRALMRIQSLLEPRGLFTAYLNHLLWLSPATAYRYIFAYKQTRDKLPEMVVTKAAASGMPLFGYRQDRPFGRYTDAVKKLPPPKEEDEAKVDRWLSALRESVKSQPGPQRMEEGVPKAEITASAAEYLAKAYERIRRKPPIVEWMQELAKMVEAKVGERRERAEEEAAA